MLFGSASTAISASPSSSSSAASLRSPWASRAGCACSISTTTRCSPAPRLRWRRATRTSTPCRRPSPRRITGPKRVRITAALAPERGARFRLETLELAEPGPDEVIVRVAASGVCQTDVHARDDYFGIPFPAVFGHEGAGVVEHIGAAVEHVAPGERVVMVSPACGTCTACARKLPGYCASARRIKFGGRLRDGRIALT